MRLRIMVRLMAIESLRSLARNTMRSGPAMLGVAVAVAIVITVIGLRCEVGARPSAIQLQFLSEAVALLLFGSGIGVGLGEINGYLFEDKLGWRLAMSPEISVIAVCVSLFAGVLFGLYPAVRATRVDPIVALRTE